MLSTELRLTMGRASISGYVMSSPAGSSSSRLCTYRLTSQLSYYNTSYFDTSFWGICLVSENLANLDDLMHFTLRDWTHISIAPTAAEVEHAKSQLKTSSLLILDGTMAIAEDIGWQLMTSSQRT